jgi:hypothetical protein
VVHDFAFVLRGDADDEPLLFCLGDAEPVVGVLDVGRRSSHDSACFSVERTK